MNTEQGVTEALTDAAEKVTLKLGFERWKISRQSTAQATHPEGQQSTVLS